MSDPKPLDPLPLSLPLRLARAGALVLALGACSTLVYREHRRANPEPASDGVPDLDANGGDPAGGSQDPADALAAPGDAPTNDTLLRSSKSAAITTMTEWEDEEVEDDPAFLFSSKSAAIPVRAEASSGSGTGTPRGLLHSSKSLILEGTGLPVPLGPDGQPIFPDEGEPIQLVPVESPPAEAADAAAGPSDPRATGEPVLLPSSKSLVIDPDYRRSLEEAATPPEKGPEGDEVPPPAEPPAQGERTPRQTVDHAPRTSRKKSGEPAGREW